MGTACGLLAIFTMGSGFLWAAPAMGGTLLDFALSKDRSRRSLLGSFVFQVAVLCIGLLLMYSPPWHEPLRAKSISDFLSYFAHCLAWPVCGSKLAAIVWHAPIGCYVIHSLATRTRHRKLDFFVLLYIWSIINIAGLAYARGAGGGYPTSRYYEIIVVGLISQGIVFLHLTTRLTGTRIGERLLQAGFWIWAIGLGFTLYSNLDPAFDALKNQSRQFGEIADNIKEYNATGNVDRLQAEPSPLPPPLKDMLVPLFSSPGMQAIMPANLRKPVEIVFPPTAAEPVEDNANTTILYASSRKGLPSASTVSAPLLISGYRYWQVEFGGAFNYGDVAMYFKDPASEESVRRQLLPPPREGEVRSARIRVPTGNYTVGVSIAGERSWIRINRIAEVSSLSFWSDYILRRSRVLTGIGVAMMVIMGTLFWIRDGFRNDACPEGQ